MSFSGYLPIETLFQPHLSPFLFLIIGIRMRKCHRFFHLEHLFSFHPVNGAGGVRQTEMHTAEPFVSEPSSALDIVAVGNLKRLRAG
jgi:hypothetical protein